MTSLRAESPDGVWTFDGDTLRSNSETVEPFTIDWFQRWTYARFLPGGELVLAFETGQPSNSDGSDGGRTGGVQVIAPRSDSSWALLAIEYDPRKFDEPFVPRDVCWSRSGVLAWLRGDGVAGVVLRSRRAEVVEDLWPVRDSETPQFGFGFEATGRWDSLEFDPELRTLTAASADREEVDLIDLDHRRLRRGQGEWEPLTVWD